MKQMTETRWRQPMWTGMMNRLPATITINMKTQSYAVRDNSLQYIFTDDIDEAGVDEMMSELADLLNPASRREFRDAFSMKRLKRAWNEDRKGYTLFSQMGGAGAITLRTDVIFGQGVRDMIMEFRLDLFDINSLLPERVYRAVEYGSQDRFDLSGRTFGKLTAIRQAARRGRMRARDKRFDGRRDIPSLLIA